MIQATAEMLNMRFSFLFILALMTNTALAQNAPRSTPPGQDFLKALSFAQHFAKPAALKPENDRQLKTTILKSLQEKPPIVSFVEVQDIFEEKEFAAWSKNKELTIAQMDALMAKLFEPRKTMIPELREHLDLLTTQLDMIDVPHQRAANQLAGWLVENKANEQWTHINVICTGNSRRSVMGAAMGNAAATYWGLAGVTFHSGGTAPSAFNARTIEALRQIKFKVTNTEHEAERGKANEANPIYRVDWGASYAKEFSKLYTHELNPQKDFAAILVCDEADEACPTVEGASIRISAPYFDPKAYDNTSLEAAKYAERRDDIGRLMLSALMQARRQLQTAKK